MSRQAVTSCGGRQTAPSHSKSAGPSQQLTLHQQKLVPLDVFCDLFQHNHSHLLFSCPRFFLLYD